MSRSSTTFLGFLVVTIAGAVWAAVALAAITDNMFITGQYAPNCIDGEVSDTFCQTDNSYFTAYIGTSIGGDGHIRDALNNFDNTDLDVAIVGTPVTSGDSETDVYYQQGTVGLGPNVLGTTWCDDAVNSFRCDQHYVRFRHPTPIQGIACHETGHAVGLTHGEDAQPQIPNQDDRLGCMMKVVDSDIDHLLDNNVDNINGLYS